MNTSAPPAAALTESDQWTDWKWQQRNAIRSVDQLVEIFPGLEEPVVASIRENTASRRMQITPYALGLIRRTPDDRSPVPDDPLWRQVAPYWTDEGETIYAYDSHTENWELPEEMVTPIAQHKYQNRIIVRLANVCHAYCQFCYEALRTLERDSTKASFDREHWNATVAYVRATPSIEEVILSGGEPLMHSETQIDRVLGDLRTLGRPIAIRIHTRALTFNPFRITEALAEVLRFHRINAVGLHVTHPNELTSEFEAAIERLRPATPIMFANMPLLHGVNDDIETMHRLGMQLYMLGVIPHYLYHFLPHSPGAAAFRTPARTGVEIVRSLKRRVSNLAVPEFVLPHSSGKHTMPLLAAGEEPARETLDARGQPVIRYTNWRGQIVDYPDVR